MDLAPPAFPIRYRCLGFLRSVRFHLAPRATPAPDLRRLRSTGQVSSADPVPQSPRCQRTPRGPSAQPSAPTHHYLRCCASVTSNRKQTHGMPEIRPEISADDAEKCCAYARTTPRSDQLMSSTAAAGVAQAYTHACVQTRQQHRKEYLPVPPAYEQLTTYDESAQDNRCKKDSRPLFVLAYLKALIKSPNDRAMS